MSYKASGAGGSRAEFIDVSATAFGAVGGRAQAARTWRFTALAVGDWFTGMIVRPAVMCGLLAALVPSVRAADAAHSHHAHSPAGGQAIAAGAPRLPIVAVDGQPLGANVRRVMEALEYLGAPLPEAVRAELAKAIEAREAQRVQDVLDAQVLLSVHINPEARVKLARGPAPAVLQQGGYTPVLVKIANESGGTQRLRLASPQAGPVYAGMARLSAERQQQQHLRVNENTDGRMDRFFEVEVFASPPMLPTLSGLELEYAIALLYSHEAGRREATLVCDVGQGTQDLGFRAEVPVLFTVNPAVAVKLGVRDFDGSPTTGRFMFVDKQGHVFPPQAKRLPPDLFFQKHIYRADGETVTLPPGELTMYYGRGPEYRWIKRTVVIPAGQGTGDGARVTGDRGRGTGDRGQGTGDGTLSPVTSLLSPEITVQLERWVHPAAYGFFSGDHHVHASGCAHYTSPSEGVEPKDMIRQVKGEALNVGSVLTWGPGFDYQQRFFSAQMDKLSEPLTVMKYDIEVSGFGSQALGHVCLLNLKEQIYPGANGSKGWPSWTLPVLRWTKAQGGVTGYAHSASGLQIEPAAAAQRLMRALDANGDGRLDQAEASAMAKGLLPEAFRAADANADGLINLEELQASHARAAQELPNVAIPELNSVGAQEIFVTAALGACDFISAMDTDRISEWNTWYHLMNCGLPLKASGETDFPCMSGTRVGQGRSYVQLGKVDRVDYAKWCDGIARGQSYVSDGYAHALEFRVGGKTTGDELRLEKPGSVTVQAKVAFSPETPLEPAYGGVIPVGGRRHVGDTVIMREQQAVDERYAAGKRLVELVVNGKVVASCEVAADGREHTVEFSVPVERSSWVALRQFPQLHTNPVNVLVAGKPIRASRESARWAIGCIDQLWSARGSRIAAGERGEAERAYEEARAFYRRVAEEAGP